jgi:hypothetical protein
MKYVINTQKKVRLVPSKGYYFNNDISIEGDSVKEVINKLLSEIEYQDWYSTNESMSFGIIEYEVGEVPTGSHSWSSIRDKERDLDLKAYNKILGSSIEIPKTVKIYFNQKILLVSDEIKNLITKHKGYKNMVRLWKEVEKSRNAASIKLKADQIAIKKENDIFLLASMMKRMDKKEFKKTLKDASLLEANLPAELKLTML